jgi:hypothetical protein
LAAKSLEDLGKLLGNKKISMSALFEVSVLARVYIPQASKQDGKSLTSEYSKHRGMCLQRMRKQYEDEHSQKRADYELGAFWGVVARWSSAVEEHLGGAWKRLQGTLAMA